MKAMRLIGLKQMSMFEIPSPKIKNDTDVRIKITHVGVCGSDIHYFMNGKIGKQVVEYPFTLGHEGAGIVESIGEKVTRVKPGDRVAIDPAMPCGQCDQCLMGRPHTCRNLKFLGCPRQAEGCLSEYIVIPEGSCFPVGDNITQEEATLSEPLSVGFYGVKLSGIKQGADIGILGAGPIGMSILASAVLQQPGKILVSDKLDYRLELAAQNGASITANPLQGPIISKIKELKPELLDIVYECSGTQEGIDDAFSLLKPGGKLMIIGIPDTARYSFPVDEMRRNEICIQNVRRQNGVLEACIQHLNNKTIQTAHWVTHRFGLKQCNEAFEMVANYKEGVLKAMIEI